jgi:type II secretory pathway component PulC
MGTVVAEDADRSLAVIENSGDTAVVRTGDAIGGARSARSQGRDRARQRESAGAAVVRRAGCGLSASATTAAAELARAHGAVGRNADTDPDSRARASRRAPNLRGRAMARRPNVRPASFQKPRTNDEVMADISRQARFQPLLDDDGKLRGVAVLGIVPDSMLERFGLQSGDVVTHVAGVKIDNTANAYNTLRGLNLRNGVEVTVVRRGASTTVNVPAGAF